MTRVLIAVGWVVVGLLGAVAAARIIAHDAAFPLVALNAFTVWLYLPAYGVLALALWLRRPALAGGAAILVLLHLAWTVPGSVHASTLPADAAGGAGAQARLMTANLLAVHPDPDRLCDEILAEDPDILVVQELSPRWLWTFEQSGLLDRYPHSFYEVRDDSFGAGIFSRFPLDDVERLDLLGVPLLRATVRLPSGAVRIYDVHPLPPRTADYAEVWDRQMALLDEELRAERGALVVAGDFNATPQSRWYRTLTAGRLRGAHEDRGRGLASTWPNSVFPLPPIRLDHVLLSPELLCLSIREGKGTGSDHRPLIADLRQVRQVRQGTD